LQLYAAIYEWRSGKYLVTEFSANSYLDVYMGHTDTLNHIREKNILAFHSMMTDIYTQAAYAYASNSSITKLTILITHSSSYPAIGVSVGVPIAELDLEELEA
jgi:Domain of unknown function (DUF6532)